MKLHALLLLWLITFPTYAAIPGGLRINSDSTGTNTHSVRITVVGQTNLQAGAMLATNSVTVGVASAPGLITLNSTNATYTSAITMSPTNWLFWASGADVFDNALLSIRSTNVTASADLFDIWNGPDRELYVQSDGSLLAGRLFAETSPGSDFFSRIQPGDLKLQSGPGGSEFVVDAATGEVRMDQSGSTTFFITNPSGYTGAGALFLSDDGTYKAVSSAPSISVSNFYATNIYSEYIYVSNLYATNIYTEYSYISNIYATNIYATEITVTNTFISKGNSYHSNLYTINLIVSNSISGTIDATLPELTLKQRKSLKLQYPRHVDGAGCTYSNTNDFTAALFMVPRFSAAGATNANWAQWAFRVPSDIDTSAALTASLTVQLAGADTDAATYTVGVVSIANSSAGAGTPANYVTLTIPADGSGASGDVESVNNVTLTGWAAALTANQWALVQLQRDGSDASAVAQDALELEIFYVSTQ